MHTRVVGQLRVERRDEDAPLAREHRVAVDLRAKAIVEATTHFQDAKILAEVSTGLGEPMVGISSASLPEHERLEVRGW